MANVVIFGVGQIAELAHFYLTHDSDNQVVAFAVDAAFKEVDSYKELPVVAYEELETCYPPADYELFIPISYKGVNQLRANKYLDAKRKGYRFISYISSKARYYDTPVGENCFIFEDNVIQPFTEIGNNVILWSGNHIGHHTQIMDHCFLASHAVVSGAVVIKPYSFIGVNATIRDNITIGESNVIGAGALILKSTDDGAVYSAGTTKLFPRSSDQLKNI